MKPPTDPTTASHPAPVVRTSPAAVRALRAAREGTTAPPCFEPTPLCAAILFALPAAGGPPMATSLVALALRSGDPAHDMPIEAVATDLVALAETGLVRVYARPLDVPEQMRWTRSERGDALPVVRARYHADDGEEQA